MNKILRKLTAENFLELLQSFENAKNVFWDEKNKKLIHPGEYGIYREDLLKKFLRLYVPEMYGISDGFIITAEDEISTQCDIIIYDRTTTPKIQNSENQRFFPIETVIAVGEVKSAINSHTELNEYLRKLSEFKKYRNSIPFPQAYKKRLGGRKFDPNKNFTDNIFTFLLCHKFNFSLDVEKIDYQSIDQTQWHNLVLSLKDGLLSYQNKTSKNIYFPFQNDEKFDPWFLKHQNETEDLPLTIEIFLAGLNLYILNCTLLQIHIERYLANPENLINEL